MGDTSLFVDRMDIHPQSLQLGSLSLYRLSYRAMEVDALGSVLLGSSHNYNICRSTGKSADLAGDCNRPTVLGVRGSIHIPCFQST